MDCGHSCCDMRDNCSHSHTVVDPNDCALCEKIKNGEPLPSVLTTMMADKHEDAEGRG